MSCCTIDCNRFAACSVCDLSRASTWPPYGPSGAITPTTQVTIHFMIMFLNSVAFSAATALSSSQVTSGAAVARGPNVSDKHCWGLCVVHCQVYHTAQCHLLSQSGQQRAIALLRCSTPSPCSTESMHTLQEHCMTGLVCMVCMHAAPVAHQSYSARLACTTKASCDRCHTYVHVTHLYT